MSANGSGRGCRAKAHRGRDLEIYDALPRPVRDKLKIASHNICSGCIRIRLKDEGLEKLLDRMDLERRMEREKRGREVWYVPREDLRP